MARIRLDVDTRQGDPQVGDPPFLERSRIVQQSAFVTVKEPNVLLRIRAYLDDGTLIGVIDLRPPVYDDELDEVTP